MQDDLIFDYILGEFRIATENRIVEKIVEYRGGGVVVEAGGGTPGTGGAVDSVNGYTGVVVLGKADIGLENVDNTSDSNKPVSTAQQTAIDAKVSDTAYGAGWNGVTDVAPSKNAVYDKIETLAGGTPAGLDREIQINNAGNFGSVTGFYYNSSLFVPGGITITGGGNMYVDGQLIYTLGGSHNIILDAGNTTTARTLYLPDKDGTLATTDDIPPLVHQFLVNNVI